MKTFATAVLFTALSLSNLGSTASNAMTVADLNFANATAFAAAPRIDLALGDQILPGHAGRWDRRDGETTRASQAYYDFDVIISLGALALAGAAFAAIAFAAARRRQADRDPATDTDWRNSVVQALEQDLLHFARGPRRAA